MNDEVNPESFREDAMQNATSRPISDEDFYRLMNLYPYLEISHPDATNYPITQPDIQLSSVGWNIHVYSDFIASSQMDYYSILRTGVDLSDAGPETQYKQEQLAVRKRLREEMKKRMTEENDQTDQTSQEQARTSNFEPSHIRPVGTINNQLFKTGLDMVHIAKKNNWPGVRIIRGFYPMRRAAWIGCESLGLNCIGFEPTPEDEVVKTWVTKHSPHTLEHAKRGPGAQVLAR